MRPSVSNLTTWFAADIDRPHVVLRIDAQPDRGVEAVDVLTQLAHELAVLIELKEPGTAA